MVDWQWMQCFRKKNWQKSNKFCQLQFAVFSWSQTLILTLFQCPQISFYLLFFKFTSFLKTLVDLGDGRKWNGIDLILFFNSVNHWFLVRSLFYLIIAINLWFNFYMNFQQRFMFDKTFKVNSSSGSLFLKLKWWMRDYRAP